MDLVAGSSIDVQELPEDVIMKIIARLPCKEVLKCQLVCKSWFKLITSCYFIHLHSNEQSKAPGILYLVNDKRRRMCVYFVREGYKMAKKDFLKKVCTGLQNVDMLPPSNGLLCFVRSSFMFLDRMHEVNICIVDPNAKKSITLPGAPERTSNSSQFIGFTYQTSIEKHKVIRVNIANLKCKVFTLGTDASWRAIGKAPYVPSDNCHAAVNGTMYWLVSVTHHFQIYNSHPSHFVFAFNTKDEKFYTIRHPTWLSYETLRSCSLGQVSGSVVLIRNFSEGLSLGFEMWKLDIQEMKEVWIKELVIRIPVDVSPMLKGRLFSIVGKQLDELVVSCDCEHLIFYNMKNGNLRCIKVVGLSELMLRRYLYAENLQIYLQEKCKLSWK